MSQGGRGRQTLRIIGGTWRGRRLRFPDVSGLRPTPDRVRETLFNWLRPYLPGAACLDLFAGSGALGLEALSQGAARAVLVESNPTAARQLRDNAAMLGATTARIVQQDALGFLGGTPEPFHVLFLDPPFQSGLLEPACTLLQDRGWLAADALVYLEQSSHASGEIPAEWEILRDNVAGDVRYRLARVRHCAA